MTKTFHVSVVSADRELFDGEVGIIAATTITGELGILAGHTPLLAALRPGQVRLKSSDGDETVIYVSGGFIEVQPKQTIILADEAARVEELDPQAIEVAHRKAEEYMRQVGDNKIDYQKAQIELEQATAQLAAIKRGRK